MILKRRIPTCSPDHQCSDEEIKSLADEIIAIFKDPTIEKVKDDVGTEKLKTIIRKAETYTGEWYHTSITLPAATQLPANTNPQYLEAYKKIETLGADHGISISYSYHKDDDIGMFFDDY